MKCFFYFLLLVAACMFPLAMSTTKVAGKIAATRTAQIEQAAQ